MTIQVAHLQDQGINFAVFRADARSKNGAARSAVLIQLTELAKDNGLRIEKSALCFAENGSTKFYGTPDLVKYLSNMGVWNWTHKLTIAEHASLGLGDEV